jgi:hypothetical protein
MAFSAHSHRALEINAPKSIVACGLSHFHSLLIPVALFLRSNYGLNSPMDMKPNWRG